MDRPQDGVPEMHNDHNMSPRIAHHRVSQLSSGHLKASSGGNLSTLSSRDRHHTSRTDIRSVISSNLDLALQKIQVIGSHLSLSEGQETCQRSENVASSEMDSCYSWVVLTACILLQLVACIPGVSSGIFLVELNESFVDKNEQTIAWIFTLQSSLSFLAGPISGFIIDKTGGRLCALLGCAGTAATLAIAALTTNFELLFICISLSGAFSCLILVPSAVVAVQFFTKYRMLALAACSACVPLVFIVIPPIITQIILAYGWREAYLSLAALCVQGSVFAMLLRPVRLLKQVTESKPAVEYGSTMSVFGRLRKHSFSNYGDSQYSIFVEEPMEITEDSLDKEKLQPYCMAKRLIEHNYESQVAAFKSDFTLDVIPEMSPLQLAPEAPIQEKLDGNEISPDISSEDISHTVSDTALDCEPPALCHWRLVLLLILNLTWGWGSSAFFVLLPTFAKSRGLTPINITHMYIVIGVSGFCGRLSSVIICNFVRRLDKVLGLTISIIVQAGALFALTAVTSFEGFSAICGIFNFAYGVCTCLGTPAILEVHGNTQLAIIYGMALLIYGTGSSFSTPFATYMGTQLGSYSLGFQFSASLVLAGGTLMVPHLVLKYMCKNKREDSEQQT